jgi:hypothetical protein
MDDLNASQSDLTNFIATVISECRDDGMVMPFIVCAMPRRCELVEKAKLADTSRTSQILTRAVKPSQNIRVVTSLSSALDCESGARPVSAAAALEHWKSTLKLIVIPSLSLIVAICIAFLFLYCTALWIDS